MHNTESTLKDCIAYLFQKQKEKAFDRNLLFTLSFKQFESLVQSDCVYCKLPAKAGQKRSYNEKTFRLNGVDRLDNKKGYIRQNVVSACLYCNYAKGASSLEDWLGWVEKVAKNCVVNKADYYNPSRMIDVLSSKLTQKNNFDKYKQNQ